MGATIPPSKHAEPPRDVPKPQPPPEEEEEEEEEDVESDIELGNEGVIDDNDEDMPVYGDDTVEVTDEMIDEANDKRSAALDAAAEGMLNCLFLFSLI